jgi:DNA-binding transcriptional MerR regulator
METDGITIALGATTAGLLIKEIAAYIRSRNQRTQVANDPLNVRRLDKFVTVGECKQHSCAMAERIRTEHEMLQNIMDKLDENDRRDEERAKSTHQRIDPLIEEIGSIRGKMEFFEKAAVNATIGGKK